MYVEKPLGISIEQNKALRPAVHAHGAIFQYGTQQRSFNTHCAFACELVRNGRIGKVQAIEVVAPNGATGGSTKEVPVPPGFDYDMWLGPAPKAPYTNNRCGNWMGTYSIYDYSIGFLGGWGASAGHCPLGLPADSRRICRHGRGPRRGTVQHGRRLGSARPLRQRRTVHVQDGRRQDEIRRHQGLGSGVAGTISAEPASLLSVKIKPDEIHLLQGNDHYPPSKIPFQSNPKMNTKAMSRMLGERKMTIACAGPASFGPRCEGTPRRSRLRSRQEMTTEVSARTVVDCAGPIHS